MLLLVVAFSPGIPAFTQPEDSPKALAEVVTEVGEDSPQALAETATDAAGYWAVAPGEWSSLEKLTDLYMSGKPSNDLTQIGLIFHGFDGTEKGWPVDDLWHPCEVGWCQGAVDHWSASVVSHQHKAVFGDVGIVFAPNLNTVMCSCFTDFGSLLAGCNAPCPIVDGDAGSTFPEDTLQDMLERSFTDPALKFAYNEVLIDSQQFVKNLPGSVGAFVFGMTGKSTREDQLQATAAYVHFLDVFNLTETDVPLLQLHHTGPQAFTDESAGARKYVEDHPHAYQAWLKTWLAEHPGINGGDLDQIPEQIPDVLRGEAEALAKTKQAKAAQKEAPSLGPAPAPKGHAAEKKAPRTDEEKVAVAEEKAAKAEEKAAKAAEKAAKAAAAVDEEKAAKAAEEAAEAAKKADEEKAAKKEDPSSGGGEPAWWRTDCKAIARTTVQDAWCAKNCGSSVPFCPTDQCECDGGNPIAYTDNTTAPSHGAKVIVQCKAVDGNMHGVSDAWCMSSCNPKAGAPPNCPTKACKCKGGNPTAEGMPAHLTPEAYEQWKENEEKKKHAQSKADKKKQDDILAEAEANKVAARDAAVAAAAERDAEREAERRRVESERQAAAQAAAQAIRSPAPVSDERLPTPSHPPPHRALTAEQEKAQKEIEDSQKAIEAAHRAAQQAQQAQQAAEPVTPAPPRELTDAELEAQRIRDEAQRQREEAERATQQAAEEARQKAAAEAERKEAERKAAEAARAQAEKERLADPAQEAEQAEQAGGAEEAEEAPEEAPEEEAKRLVKDEAARSRSDGHKGHKPKPAHYRGDGHKWHEAKPED